MQQLTGAFEACQSSEIKSSVLKSGNHESPFDMRSSVRRVPAGRVLGSSDLVQQQLTPVGFFGIFVFLLWFFFLKKTHKICLAKEETEKGHDKL